MRPHKRAECNLGSAEEPAYHARAEDGVALSEWELGTCVWPYLISTSNESGGPHLEEPLKIDHSLTNMEPPLTVEVSG